MAERTLDDRQPSVLDRTIDLTAVSWSTIAWIAAATVAAMLRFAQLGMMPLSKDEAHSAFDAFSFFRGDSSGPGHTIGRTGPFFLLLRSFAFFLFDASDATARIVPALLGVMMIGSIAGLRPFVGNARALGMAILAAFSPTLVYASRTVTAEIAVAAFSLLFLVALLRIGLEENGPSGAHRWAFVAGLALAATYASGASSISVLIAMADRSWRRGFRRFKKVRTDPRHNARVPRSQRRRPWLSGSVFSPRSRFRSRAASAISGRCRDSAQPSAIGRG